MRRPGDSPNFSRSLIVGMDQWMPDYQRHPDECASLIEPHARRAQKLMLDSWVCFCNWCRSVRSSVSAGRSRSRVRCLRHTQVHAVAFGRGLVESDISVTKQVQEANSNLENTSKNFHTTTLSLCDPMTHASMDVIAVMIRVQDRFPCKKQRREPLGIYPSRGIVLLRNAASSFGTKCGKFASRSKRMISHDEFSGLSSWAYEQVFEG